MRVRGMGLGVTLVIVGLIALVGFSLSGLVVTRIGLLSRMEQRRLARNAADSAITQALDRLLNQPDTARTPVRIEGPNGEIGVLSFEPGAGVPLSFYNLSGANSATTADGRTVPPSSARLVAKGTCGSSQQTIETMLAAPLFPFAVSAAGGLESQGGLIVASVGNLLPETLDKLRQDPALYGGPAHILSNWDSTRAVSLQGRSTICGDVVTAGGVDFSGNPVEILGEVRERQEQAEIPNVPLADFHPQTLDAPFSNLNAGTYPAHVAASNLVFAGSARFTGDLKLENCIVYVKGDLEVGGDLLGRGILVVEGKAKLKGKAGLQGAGRMAVLCGGDVSLEGADPAGSFFQGVLFTRGRLDAKRVTVIGALVGAAPATGPPPRPQIVLQDTVIVSDAGAVGLTGAGVDGVLRTLGANYMTRFPLNVHAEISGPNRLTITPTYNGRVGVPGIFELNNPAHMTGAYWQANLHPELHCERGYLRLDTLGQGIDPEDTLPFQPQTDESRASLLRNLYRFLQRHSGAPCIDLSRFISPRERTRIATYRLL